MAEDKPKYDLSNVGGQPKHWLDKAHESGEDDWWQDVKMSAAFFGVPLAILVCLAGFLYLLLKYAGKL